MTRTLLKKTLSTLLLFISLTFSTFAEIIEDDVFNFSLDLPEGYVVKDYTDDGMSYLFEHPNIPVSLALKIENANSSNTKAVLQNDLTKLSATSIVDSFYWHKDICSISSFTMNLGDEKAGWAVCAPTEIQNYYIVLICYAPAKQEAACEQFIMSTINSLCIHSQNINQTGIITCYAFPDENNQEINLNINGSLIKTSINQVDITASQFVVDLEYGVLSLYGKHKLWKEAWERYYRIIYRDSYGRLEKVSKDIHNVLYPLAIENNEENPDIYYAQLLLTWVQNFNYQRADSKSDSDFTALPAIITGSGSDCDSRSLLICLLLKSAGIDSILLISPEYSHAMAGAFIEAPGQKYAYSLTSKDYLLGETTANVTWGKIAQDFQDRSKWIPIDLP